MPDTSNRELPSPEPELAKQLIVPNVEAKTQRRDPPSPIPSTEMGTPKEGYDDDDVTEEEEENVGTVATPPRRFLDTQYGNRRDGEQLMIVHSPVFIDTDDNVTIKWTAFRGTEGLWELLTRNNVNTQLIGKGDLKT